MSETSPTSRPSSSTSSPTAPGQPAGAEFSPADLPALAEHAATLKRFENFLLTRLADYLDSGKATGARGQTIPAPDRTTFPRDSGGYGTWSLESRVDVVARNLDLGNIDVVHFRHFLSDDRGGAGVATVVKVPVAHIFDDTQRVARYALYRELRAEFEPDAS